VATPRHDNDDGHMPGVAVPGGAAPARPPDEAARLADLRALGAIERGPDPELDSLADLAALVAGSPIALVSIVEEDEQVFTAAVGLDADRMPRDISFCGHAIADGPGPMVVPDARQDPRFAANPIVTGGPGVVFYAGVPILTSRGHALGTLCVVDHQPRALSERQMAALSRLAAQAAGVIEGRAAFGDARARAADESDPETGLALRNAMVRRAGADGGLPVPSSAVALRVEEIDASGAHGGLLAGGAVRSIARAMQGCLPYSAEIARSFGNFVVLLPGSDGAGSRAVVAALRNRLRGPIVLDSGQSLHAGLTAAVATTGAGGGAGPDDLVASAEAALLRTETFGLSCILVDEGARTDRARAATIRDDLAKAVTNGQLAVYYQPVVRIPGEDVVGEEALVRWRHPSLGLLAPGEFIPFAEDMGIVQEIDRYVMRRALADFAAGRARGHEVSVNLSPASIQPTLPEVVAADLRNAGVRPESLILEITERVRFDREPGAVEVLRRLGDIGVGLAIDDFGAGTTSLAHLRTLPVSRLKIDRSLVHDLGGPDAERAGMVLRTLADLAGHLEIDVVGEGVEEPDQRDALIRSGISLAQGFLFGRPAPLLERAS